MNLNYGKFALVGGIFVLGVGAGIIFSSSSSFSPDNVASREVIDRSAPNADLCIQYGASAIVSDLRVFITLNPFSVYVTQPAMQPGCVLRQSNMTILEQKRLVTSEQVRDCKNRMNSFGFVGSLDSNPKIDCVYPNDAAGNLFLNPPGSINPRSDNNNF
jgi:hypothetical protein